MDRKEQTAVFISGSSSGIGQALTKILLARGYVVLGCSRSSATILDDNYIHFVCDLTVEEHVISMCEEINSSDYYPSILINGAGQDHAELAVQSNFGALQSVMLINSVATMNLTNHFLSTMMRKNNGRIINLLSICAPLGLRGSSIYSASKKAIEGYVGCIINEVKGFDITINNIGLSYVAETHMSEKQDDRIKAQAKKMLAKPAEISHDEIMHAIDFFISKNSSNITGQTLYFGGIS